MNDYRRTANNRSEFAREKWNEILKSFHPTDTISGYKARKLAQAYRIYIYYLFVFNGSVPNGTAVFNVMEYNIMRRKNNWRYKSRRTILQNR